MTLFQIIQILKEIALAQPNIKSATDGSIYEVMNTNPSVKYDVVHFSQTTHQSDEETDYYGLNIFYVSRLEDSLEDNRLQIQSIGKEVLDNIIRTFCENWNIDFPVITYTPFTQKFNDLCAGCYCNLRLEIPKQIICADDYIAEVVPGSGIKLQDIGITITQNGLRVITPDFPYDGIGEIRIVTDVPQASADLQYKEVEYTENGEYTVRPDPDYDGLTEVAVSVVVPDRYDEGYDDGKEDGIDEQKAKLESLSVSANGEYTRADGYSAITVDVPQYSGGTYQEGYEDGEAAQKAKLVSTAVTENGTYSKPDGYSAITVNVPQGEGYEEGYADGEAAQKAKLVSTAVTENGTYSREDGYSAITVNVPQGQGYEEGYEDGEAAQKAKLTVTSFTQNDTYTRADGWSAVTIDVDDRYDEGYADGFAAGASACSGYFITAITLNVNSAVTDSATATTTFSPLTSITDIYYTSSDPSIATIDSVTGVITVLDVGVVTFTTTDRFTGLRDSKNVTVTKTPGPGPEPEYKDMYLTTLALGDGNMTIEQTNPYYHITYYRINKGNWTATPRDVSYVDIPVQSGDIVEYKSTIQSPSTTHITSNCIFEVYGNIMSLSYGDDFKDKTSVVNVSQFQGLFSGATGLTSAENLIMSADTLEQNCYRYMFRDCTSLTTAPELPATTLASYCYEYMFAGCTSLTTAPELPDFYLPSGAGIPANAYGHMFSGCTSLNYIKCLVSKVGIGTSLFEFWVKDVSATGTFVKNANMEDWTIGINGIPENWTVVDNS